MHLSASRRARKIFSVSQRRRAKRQHSHRSKNQGSQHLRLRGVFPRPPSCFEHPANARAPLPFRLTMSRVALLWPAKHMEPAGRRRTAAPPTRSGPEGSSRNGLRTGRRPVCTSYNSASKRARTASGDRGITERRGGRMRRFWIGAVLGLLLTGAAAAQTPSKYERLADALWTQVNDNYYDP